MILPWAGGFLSASAARGNEKLGARLCLTQDVDEDARYAGTKML